MKFKGIVLFIAAVVIAGILLIVLRGRKQEKKEVADLVTHRNLGLAYLEESQPQEAEGEFLKLIELAPEEAIGYANLGVVYLRLGKYAEAEAQVKKALEKSKDPDVQLILAEIYERSGKEQDALRELEAILRNHPDYPQANYKMGQLYARDSDLKDRWTKAEEHLARVVESMPGNLPARLQLTEAQLRNNNVGPALTNWEQIRQQVPELPPDAIEFYDKARSLMLSSKAQEALSPALAVHNLLKPTPLYQAGIFELSGPGPSFLVSPIVHFSDNISLQQHAGVGTPVVRFTDVTSSTGLDIIHSDDWPEDFSTSLALGDYDSDGDPDLYTGNSLLRNDRRQFVDVSAGTGIKRAGRSTAAVFADYNNDASLDLYVAGDSGGVLYENQGNGKLLDVTESAGLQKNKPGSAAFFLDLDQDGDLDLYVVSEGGNRAYRNNSDGRFIDVSAKMAIVDGNTGGRAATFGDFDEDGDIDLFLINKDTSNTLYTNLRQGQFQDVTSQSGLSTNGKFASVTQGDYNNDGFLDLFVGGLAGTSALLRNKGDDTFEKDTASTQLNEALQIVDGFDAVFFDFDNDGFLDLLITGKAQKTGKSDLGVLLFHNDGTGKFTNVSSLLPEDLKSARKVAVADYDMDGDLDLFILDSSGKVRLLRNDGGNTNHWLNVQLIGLGAGSGKNNRDGIGAKVEVKAGNLYQMRVVTDPVLHFGLGSHPKADVVRIVWTNGVPQNHLQPNANQKIVEKQVLKGSCFFLYAWNGHEYKFVTDIMWRSALGMPLGIMGGTTAYAFADSTDEHLKLPGEYLKPKDGKYSIQITEELWETAYLDKTRLVVIDHPKSVDIFVDERFVPPPIPAVRIFSVGEKNLPVSAHDDRGNDLLPLLRMKDDQYISDLKAAKYQGITELHDLILNLGELLPTDKIVLFLNGWIFPSDASINVAVSQSSQIKVVPPYLQILDSNGDWQTVIPNLSFPMGKDKVIVADLTGKFLTNDYRVRIRTSMEIYWDHVFFSRNELDISLRQTTLEPVSSDVHYRGFSRMYRKGAHGPHWFDYSNVTSGPQWRDLEGNYTRYGDVTSLLMESDDQYVIINAGDEISIQFDASRVPQLPPGWSRDYLIYTDGWIKDGDLNTAFSKTVDPLPFHAMTSYPYGKDESYPSDEQHQQYLRTYNTRNIRATKFRKMP